MPSPTARRPRMSRQGRDLSLAGSKNIPLPPRGADEPRVSSLAVWHQGEGLAPESVKRETPGGSWRADLSKHACEALIMNPLDSLRKGGRQPILPGLCRSTTLVLSASFNGNGMNRSGTTSRQPRSTQQIKPGGCYLPASWAVMKLNRHFAGVRTVDCRIASGGVLVPRPSSRRSRVAFAA